MKSTKLTYPKKFNKINLSKKKNNKIRPQEVNYKKKLTTTSVDISADMMHYKHQAIHITQAQSITPSNNGKENNEIV